MSEDEAEENVEFDAKVKASRDELLILRAEAIDAYAWLEHHLCSLLRALTSMSNEDAGVIFYRITNSRARNAILEKLLHLKADPKHRPFWNSMIKFIGQLDSRRNEIVHWHMLGKPQFDHVASVLSPPGQFGFVEPGRPTISPEELRDFIDRAEYAVRRISFFLLFFTPRKPKPPRIISSREIKIPKNLRATWRETFLRPLAYQPGESPRLSQKLKEHRSQPRPSRG